MRDFQTRGGGWSDELGEADLMVYIRLSKTSWICPSSAHVSGFLMLRTEAF